MKEMSKNIILIGRPDSEKAAIGKIISEKLGFKFVDTDQGSGGEEYNKFARSKCTVISTEADVIKSHPDIKGLRENGVVIFIDNKGQLKDEKHEIHRKCCDLHLVNDNNIDEIVFYICSLWGLNTIS
ncbi:MAG: shikimate kinase [Firmicutes bacterium]|nr:shikimate kinase [Bacillota bacterium]